MLYPFLTLEDDTEIVHSDMDEKGFVDVCIEKPVNGGFHSAKCRLPDLRWVEVDGFSPTEIANLQELIQRGKPLIMHYAKNGGFEHASSF